MMEEGQTQQVEMPVIFLTHWARVTQDTYSEHTAWNYPTGNNARDVVLTLCLSLHLGTGAWVPGNLAHPSRNPERRPV